MKERGLESGFFLQDVKMCIDNPNYYRLSPFQQIIDKKLSPIKLRHQMYSNRKERPTKQMTIPETVLLSASQVDALDEEFVKIKRSRHELMPARKSLYVHDSLYKSLYIQKQKGNQHRYNRSYDHRLPTLGRFSETAQNTVPGSALK